MHLITYLSIIGLDLKVSLLCHLSAAYYDGGENVLRIGLGREDHAEVIPPFRLFSFTWRRHDSKLLKHP